MLLAIRLTLVLALVTGIAWVAWRPRQVGKILRGFFLEEIGPLNLAIFRILLFGTILARSLRGVGDYTSVPPVLRALPPGWGWIGEIVPLFDQEFANDMRWVTCAAAAFTLVGLGTRVAAPIAALGAVYLFGLPNFFNKINHGSLALVWCAIVLSASSSNRALALDALIVTARRNRPRLSMPYHRSSAYGLPIRICWFLFGVAYFFPGLYKAWEAGDLWLTGAAPRHHMLGARVRAGFVPLLHLSDHQVIMVLMGVGTLFFELGFVFFLFSRRFRWVAPVMGISFHLMVWQLLGIHFMSMLGLYYCFIDFEWVLTRIASRIPMKMKQHLVLPTTMDPSDVNDSLHPRVAPVAIVGSVLVAANLFAGFARVNSWPISHFPLFDGRSINEAPTVRPFVVTVKRRGHKLVEVDPNALTAPIQTKRWQLLLRHAVREQDPELRKELAAAVVDLARKAGYEVLQGDRISIVVRVVQVDEATGKKTIIKQKPRMRWRLGKHDRIRWLPRRKRRH